MKTIRIYYDKADDRLSYNARCRHGGAVAKVAVPDESERDGDCLILPDHPNACFKRRRVTATELLLRAVMGSGDVSVVELALGPHSFPRYGKHKPGTCLHGRKFPCPACTAIRPTLEKGRGRLTDAEFAVWYTRKDEAAEPSPSRHA